ncbi:hypothetical protein BOTBODRAFT_90697, partial [Botryobasidium botryosum FD-172 SS1]
KTRIFDEVYTSDCALKEYAKIMALPPEPGCDLERGIFPMMLASDATHPTMFGQAKVWPGYMSHGGISKYHRCKRDSRLMEHIAYFPTLPDDVQDILKARLSRKACDEAITHCKRELMHASWKLIIDDLFLEDWRHGIVVEFPDGVRRRLYPRIFTYTADYPEKVLLATLRNNGACPCPRCLVDKSDIHRMGMLSDQRCRTLYQRRDNQERRTRVKKARDLIYGRMRRLVGSSKVEDIMKQRSEVPTENAFSLKLSEFGFDYFDMLVSDFLHEWELGEWKTLFVHIMRIL